MSYRAVMKLLNCILLPYIIVALIFLVGDFCWLSLSNPRLYQPVLAPLLAAQPDWLAVAVFYPLYFVGILFFVVQPLAKQRSRVVFGRGLLFGFVAYATYDLTNQATLIGWPWYLSAIDMSWGALITGVSAALGRCALNKIVQKSA